MVVDGLRKTGKVVETAAVEDAAGIDLGAALGGAELARAVEILESQPDGIGDLVTSRAHRVGAVQVEAFTRGFQARVGVLEEREIHVGRRARNRLAKQQFAHRLAAQRRRTASRVCVCGQEADLGQQPRARAVRRAGISGPAGGRRDVVDDGERRRHKRIAAREQVAVVAFPDEQVVDQRTQRLLARIHDRLGTEHRVDAGILRQDREIVEAQHVVEEGAHAGLETRARQHAVD